MRCIVSCLSMLLIAWPTRAEESPRVSPAVQDAKGWLVHQIESPYQPAKTRLRVLLPDEVPRDRKLPVVYVLPVEAQGENRYGDGLEEVKKLDLANKLAAIFVAPDFSQLPWYANHPTDPAIRQESHFVKAVVPFVEKSYPARSEPAGRLLLGFSKSGWGAWSLLLRHSDQFGRAAAWDAPLMMNGIRLYGSGPIFGTQENFEKYRLVNLLREQREALSARPRLILTAFGNFGREHQQMAELLEELRIPRVTRYGPERKHDWHSGWVAEAVELLLNPEAAETR
jgi:hypothetical protein